MTDELSEWERGFLAGVAFRETFGFEGPTSVPEVAARAYRDPDALVADVEIPGGLRFTADDIVPTVGPGVDTGREDEDEHEDEHEDGETGDAATPGGDDVRDEQ